MKKIMTILALTLAFPLLQFQTLYAAETGTVQVDLSPESMDSIQGVQIGLVQWATGSGTYTPDSFFSSLSIDPDELDGNMEYEQAALELYEDMAVQKGEETWSDFLEESGLSYQLQTTTQEGRVRFSNLEKGVYVVFEIGQEDEKEFAPMLAYIPTIQGSKESYFVFLSPKPVIEGTPIIPRLVEDPNSPEDPSDPQDSIVDPEEVVRDPDLRVSSHGSEHLSSTGNETTDTEETNTQNSGTSDTSQNNSAQTGTSDLNTGQGNQNGTVSGSGINSALDPVRSSSVNTAAGSHVSDYLLLAGGALTVGGVALWKVKSRKDQSDEL